MDNLGSRRGGRPPRRVQLWRPQPAGGSAPSSQTTGGRDGELLRGDLQRTRDNAGNGMPLMDSAMEHSGLSFSSQDVRSLRSTQANDSSMLRKSESNGRRRQEDPASVNRVRLGRSNGLAQASSSDHGGGNAVRSHQRDRGHGESRQRNSRGRRDGRMEGPDRHLERGRGLDGDGSLDGSNFMEVNASTVLHLHNGHGQSSGAPQDQALDMTTGLQDAVRSQDVRSSRTGPVPATFGRGRQQWRPASAQTESAGRSNEHINGSVLTSEAVEASRGAVNEVLQSLSIHRSGRGASNRTSHAQGHQTTQKYFRGQFEPANQFQRFVSGESAQRDKTTIPQLVQELEEKLSKGQVECMICYDMVRREAAVWSCGGYAFPLGSTLCADLSLICADVNSRRKLFGPENRFSAHNSFIPHRN